jgi:hypothetical protein
VSELHRVELAAGSLAEIGLGLVAVIQRFDALVNAYAPPRASPVAADESIEPVLDLVLGLVAIRARIQAQLDGCEASSAPSTDDATQESWLR